MTLELDTSDSAYRDLTAAGMHPDRDLLGLFDLDKFTADPRAFVAAAKKQCPKAFAFAGFDAMTAKPAEVDAFCRQLERDRFAADRQRTRDAAAKIGDTLKMFDAEFAEAERILCRVR